MVYLQFGKLAAQMQSFSAWLASSNQDAHDLSVAGYFYTGAALYNKNLIITSTNIFSKTPLIQNCFCYRSKRPHNLSPLRCCSKGLESYWFGLVGTCNMESEMCLRTTYKKPCILFIRCISNKVMYSGCGLVQLFLFRLQLYQVRVPLCML